MTSINKVILMGRFGADPELKNTQTGKRMCTFSIATTEKYKNSSGEFVEKTEWHNCIAWGKIGENINKFFKKKDRGYFEGSNTTEDWTDKDGNKRRTTKINISTFQFVDSKKSEGTSINNSSGVQVGNGNKINYSNNTIKTKSISNQNHNDSDFIEDDIPF